MKNISLRDIKQGYHGLKKIAQKSAQKGDYSNTIKYIDHCVTVASQFNWIYADDEIEELLDILAQSIIDTSFVGEYVADENNWVFFDDYCTSYVLALQWMKALSKTGKNIRYITTQSSFKGDHNISILPEIEKLSNVTIDIVPDGSYFDRSNHLFHAIVTFKASKVILHKAMNSLIQLPLCVLPKEISIYNINLGDQFFWLGVRHIDYNIEFRPFGTAVSLKRRGFIKKQILMIPFYPANEGRAFQGFPKECEGKLVIFSGGDYYKTWDKGETFWRLVKNVLDTHPNVVFLYAIKRKAIGTEKVEKFIRENQFEGRFIQIERRNDIFQVFAHCDIYMGTCPISGSLMSQLAAINGKPILQYYPPGTPDDETEQALCINDSFPISFTTESGFYAEANSLIINPDYRKKQGNRIRAAMMQPEQFDKLVAETLRTNQSQMGIIVPSIDFRIIDKRWLMLEKMGFTDAGSYLYSLLNGSCLFIAPGLFIKKKIKIVKARLDRGIKK